MRASSVGVWVGVWVQGRRRKKTRWAGSCSNAFHFQPGGRSLIPRGFVPGVMYPVKMLPYPHPVAGDREVETRLRVRVGAGLCQQRVSFSASNPPHFETSKPICATVDILHHFFFYPLSLLYRTTRAPHRAGTRAPGYVGTYPVPYTVLYRTAAYMSI